MAAQSSINGQKKLTRSSKNAVIGGVCGGLGQYFNIDPTLIRLLFLFLFLIGGGGLLLYILLWLFIPSDIPAKSALKQLLIVGAILIFVFLTFALLFSS